MQFTLYYIKAFITTQLVVLFLWHLVILYSQLN